ncbi:hypothetical protein AB3X52_04080 [Nocardioides sp. DS6]|uniref:DUF222 domain-containing protein n=1 Tax=Nocardioides eburneus TaxID=3231482 RepID=A0ABV3SV21_9ACTN
MTAPHPSAGGSPPRGVAGRLEDLTRAERRARTADLLSRVPTCHDALARSRLMVEIAALNLCRADAVAHRYRHPAIDRRELRDCVRRALLQGVATFAPTAGDDLWAQVMPVVRRAALGYVSAHPLSTVRELYAGRDRALGPEALRGLLGESGLDQEQTTRLLGTLSGLTWTRRLPPRERWLLCLQLLKGTREATPRPTSLPLGGRPSRLVARVLPLLGTGAPRRPPDAPLPSGAA